MKLKEVLAISGHSGLFKYISQGRNGIIVESFADKKRTFVSATTKVSALEDIAIYTDEEEVPLRKVIKSIREKEGDGKAIDPKSGNEELKNYLAEILPNYDRENVYVSDIRKIMQWYNILHEHQMLDFEEDSEKESENGSAGDQAAENLTGTEEVKDKSKKPPLTRKAAAISKAATGKASLQKANTKAAGQKKTVPKKTIG